MPTKNDRWLDHTGLNLIRIVIGSYFMATSLGLIDGVDHSALFAPFLADRTAGLAGSATLFTLSLAFMAGVRLRMVSLVLALFLLGSSAVENYLQPGARTVSPFWRDLALVSAVLLSYASLRRREVRKAALFMRRRATRIRRDKQVTPRRVSLGDKPVARRPAAPDYHKVLRPLIAPTGPIRRPDGPVRESANEDSAAPARATGTQNRLLLVQPMRIDDDDTENIFSNI